MLRQAKTYDYVVEIKKGSTKYIDYISLLMIVISIISLIYHYLFQNLMTETSWYKTNLPLLIVLVLVLSFGLAYYKYKLGDNLYFAKTIAIAGVSWLIIPNLYLLIIPYIIASFLERPLKVKPEYGFDEDGVAFNSFPQQQYKWDEISNVVIRFGMLTIDFKNNKIVHAEVSDEINFSTENEFNDYCKKQLNTASTID